MGWVPAFPLCCAVSLLPNAPLYQKTLRASCKIAYHPPPTSSYPGVNFSADTVGQGTRELMLWTASFLRVRPYRERRAYAPRIDSHLGIGPQSSGYQRRRDLLPRMLTICLPIFPLMERESMISRVPLVLMASWVVQLVKNLPAMQETPVRSLGGEVRLEKG